MKKCVFNISVVLLCLFGTSIQAYACSDTFSGTDERQRTTSYRYVRVGKVQAQLREGELFLVANDSLGGRQTSISLRGQPVRLLGKIKTAWLRSSHHILVETSVGLEYFSIDSKGRVIDSGLVLIGGNFHQLVFGDYLVFSRGNTVFYTRVKTKGNTFKGIGEEEALMEFSDGRVQAIELGSAKGGVESFEVVSTSSEVHSYTAIKFLEEVDPNNFALWGGPALIPGYM